MASKLPDYVEVLPDYVEVLPEGPSALTRGYQKAVAPITRQVADVVANPYGVTQADPLGILTPPTEEDRRRGRFVAEAVVPQTPTDAAIAVGTLGAGGLAARAALSPAKAAVARIAGGTAGGGAGAAAEGKDWEEGLKQGLIATTAGEVVGAAGRKLETSIPGGRDRVANRQAAAVGEEIRRQSPGLYEGGVPGAGGVYGGTHTSSERLYDLAAGPGKRGMQAAKQRGMTEVENIIGGPQTQIHFTTLGGRNMTLQEANDELSVIGQRAFSKLPSERTVDGIDQRQLYGALREEIGQQLEGINPLANRIWQNAQQEYHAGVGLLKGLRRQRAFTVDTDQLARGRGGIGDAASSLLRSEGGTPAAISLIPRTVAPDIGTLRASGQNVKFNAGDLQRWAGQPRVREDLVQRLGDDGYKRFLRALYSEGQGVSAPAQAFVNAVVNNILSPGFQATGEAQE